MVISLDWRLRAIDSATESIAFQTFLWDVDTVGQAIERHLRIAESGQVQWVSDDQKLDHLPTHSFMLSIEDWFFAHLPIEGEM